MTGGSIDVDQLSKDAMKVNFQDFTQLIKDTIEYLRKERGDMGNFRITGKLVEAKPQGEAIIIGDIHGDFDSIRQILRGCGFITRVERREQPLLIFLGDYGDRGSYSPEVYHVVLNLKKSYPANVVLMRGNHEGPDDLLASPHDLPHQMHNKFGEKWSIAYQKLKELFNELYTGLIFEDSCVLLHGGVPSRARSSDDLAYAHLKHPNESYLEEILWSDPEEGRSGIYPSPRGAGNLFGEDVTAKFLETLGAKVLIRGHEPCDAGYKISHSGKILTLFSRKGEPYFNSLAAYLRFDLTRDFKDAFELQRFIKQL